MSNQLERQFTVNFPISSVKNALEKTLHHKAHHSNMESKNDVFNSYTVSFVSSLQVIRASIQLKSISESVTEVVLTSNEQIYNSGKEARVNEVFDKFFRTVGDVLLGRDTLKEAPKKKGGNVVLIICILISILMIIGAFARHLE